MEENLVAEFVHSVTQLETLCARRPSGKRKSYMFKDDETALLALNDLAKKDSEALSLLLQFGNTKDFGEMDSLICRIHRYLEDRESND